MTIIKVIKVISFPSCFVSQSPPSLLFNSCFDDATIGVAGTDVMKRHRAVRDAFTVLSKFIRPPVCKKNQSWPS